MSRLPRWCCIGIAVFCLPLAARVAPLQDTAILQVPFAGIGEAGGLAILGSGMIFVSVLLRKARRRTQRGQNFVQLHPAKPAGNANPVLNELVGSKVR